MVVPVARVPRDVCRVLLCEAKKYRTVLDCGLGVATNVVDACLVRWFNETRYLKGELSAGSPLEKSVDLGRRHFLGNAARTSLLGNPSDGAGFLTADLSLCHAGAGTGTGTVRAATPRESGCEKPIHM
jgi:hypothetical protein